MLCAVFAVVGGTGYYYVSVFNFDAEVGVYGLLEGALRTLDCDFFAGYRNGDAGGYCYGGFSYT